MDGNVIFRNQKEIEKTRKAMQLDRQRMEQNAAQLEELEKKRQADELAVQANLSLEERQQKLAAHSRGEDTLPVEELFAQEEIVIPQTTARVEEPAEPVLVAPAVQRQEQVQDRSVRGKLRRLFGRRDRAAEQETQQAQEIQQAQRQQGSAAREIAQQAQERETQASVRVQLEQQRLQSEREEARRERREELRRQYDGLLAGTKEQLQTLQPASEQKQGTQLQSEQLTGQASVESYAELLAQQAGENGILADHETILERAEEGKSRETLAVCLQILTSLMQMEDRTEANVDALAARYLEAVPAEDTMAREQLEKGPNHASAKWVFLVSAAAHSLNTEVRKLEKGALDPERMMKVQALSRQAELVSDGLYLSEAYRQEMVGQRERELGLADTRATMESLQKDRRALSDGEQKKQKKLARLEKEQEKLQTRLSALLQSEEKRISSSKRKGISLQPYFSFLLEDLSDEEFDDEKLLAARLRECETRVTAAVKTLDGFWKEKKSEYKSETAARVEVMRKTLEEQMLYTLYQGTVSEEAFQDGWVAMKQELEKGEKAHKLASSRMEKKKAAYEEVQEVVRESRAAREALLEREEQVRVLVQNGVSPVLCGFSDVAQKKYPDASYRKVEKARNCVAASFEDFTPLQEELLVQLLVARPEYQLTIKKSERADLLVTLEKMEQLVEEKLAVAGDAGAENLDLFEQRRKGVLTHLLSSLGPRFFEISKELAAEEKGADHTASDRGADLSASRSLAGMVSAHTESALKNEEQYQHFAQLEEQCLAHPLLADLYNSMRRALSYDRYALAPGAYAEMVEKRVRYMTRRIELMPLVEAKCGDNLRNQAGVLLYLEKDLLQEAYSPERMSEKMDLLLANDAAMADFAASDAFLEGGGHEMRQNLLSKLTGRISSDTFRQKLLSSADDETKEKMRNLQSEPNLLRLFALILSFPHLLGEHAGNLGMSGVYQEKDLQAREHAAGSAVQNFCAGDEEELNNLHVDYSRALTELTGKSADAAKIKINGMRFMQAYSFVQVCIRQRDVYREKTREKTPQELEQERNEEKAAREKRRALAVRMRSAATEEKVKASGNERAEKLLGRVGEMTGLSALTDFLTEQAKADGQDALLAGFRNLTDRQRHLVFLAVSRRDCLDISKRDIGWDRLGVRTRDYCNPAEREKLIENYKNHNLLALSAMPWQTVFYGLLSSRIDDTEEKKDVFSKRRTAVDWKLVQRALQLVSRTENERDLIGNEELLFQTYADEETLGEFRADPQAMHDNIHHSGTRFTRYIGRMFWEKVTDWESIPEGIQFAVSQIFSEKNLQRSEKLRNFKESVEKKVAPITGIKERAEGRLNKVISEEKRESISDKWETAKQVKELAGMALSTAKDANALYEAAQIEKRLAGEQANEPEKLRLAKSENMRNVRLAMGEAIARNFDEAINTAADMAGDAADKLMGKDIGSKVVSGAAHMVNFVRSYAHDLVNIVKFFDIDAKMEEYKKSMAPKQLGPMTMLQKVSFFAKANGYQNLTELSTVIGMNLTQSILFSASRYNMAQPHIKQVAAQVLVSVGKLELLNDLSADSARELFEAIMGSER